MIDHNHKHQWI